MCRHIEHVTTDYKTSVEFMRHKKRLTNVFRMIAERELHSGHSNTVSKVPNFFIRYVEVSGFLQNFARYNCECLQARERCRAVQVDYSVGRDVLQNSNMFSSGT